MSEHPDQPTQPNPPPWGQQRPPVASQYGQQQPPPQHPQYGQPTRPFPQESSWQQPAGQPMPPPQQFQPGPLPPDQQRLWAMLSHLIPLFVMIVSAGFLGFIGSLVIYLLFKDRGDFVRRHCANSLNVQIFTFIGTIVSVPLMFMGIGFLTYGAVIIWSIVMHIIGAVKASSGKLWDPPLTPAMIR